MSTIAELAEDRVVEGIYAVARKRRLRTKSGSAYLALELVDPSGRIEGRVWNDVELLDARFDEGDAVRVLGRVERYRDRLQLDVRSIEAAPDERPCRLRPRDAPRPGRARRLPRVPRRRDLARRAALRPSPRSSPTARSAGGCGRCRRHPTGTTTTRAGCSSTRSASRRSAASSASCTRGSVADLLLAAALLHDIGRTVELEPGPGFRQTAEGRLLGHVHLGTRLIEERAGALDPDARAELLHAVACHHDARAAKTAEAAVLYHANQLDAVAATRPVDGT